MLINIKNSFAIISSSVFLLLANISCSNNMKTKDSTSGNAMQTSKVDDKWAEMKMIEKSIAPPTFKSTVYNILDYGAKGDGVTNCTKAFEKAIAICTKNGGGKVVVPKGIFFTGPIHLDNNVNLYLEEGSEIRFSTNPSDFPLVHTSFEGMELMNYSPLIYANNKKNIAVTGKGILNGQANETNWWPWKGVTSEGNNYGYKKGDHSQADKESLPRLMEMADQDIPVEKRIFGKNYYLRPNFIEPFECENVLIQGVKIVNAPFWILHPMKSRNVTIDGVEINSHGPNNDGCDPEYSKNILIKNCTFNTGDDCIAIKAGRDNEGRKVGIPSENIIVKNCKMIDGHGGVVIGSEMSAGVRNVFVEDCVMDSPELDRAIRLKTNTKRGGFIKGVYVRNIKVGKVKETVLKIDMHYSVYGGQDGNFIPEISDIYLENIDVDDAGKYAIHADGLENSKINNVVFKNVKIKKVKENFFLRNIENLQIIDTYMNNKKVNNP